MQSRPVVAILTARAAFAAELQSAFESSCDAVVCPTFADVDNSHDRQFAAIVVDTLETSDGGHELDRWLERRESGGDPSLVVMISDSGCPEILARRATCSGIPVCSADSGVATIARRIVERLSLARESTASASRTEFDDQPAGADAEVVLRGVTRQFETNSVQLKAMLEDLAVAAEHDVTILLVGETGSGKTFLSRLIHEASPRRDEPFLHVACGALPRDLVETELFGHAKGSFTSAHADKEGKFVAARRGTILLDEIDVLSPEQQVKLLKVIETGEFEPVGSNETLKSEARLVVASNLDLQPLVDSGRFRPDLYYRLNMLKFELPPLRRRRMDITPLAKQFIRKFQAKHNIAIARIDEGVMDALVSYPWPGNVRELENVIQRAVIYCRDGRLTTRQLPSHIVAGNAGPANDPSVRLEPGFAAADQSLSTQVALTEKEIIEQALFQNNNSKTRTAQALGISRVTLYNKLKKHDMTP